MGNKPPQPPQRIRISNAIPNQSIVIIGSTSFLQIETKQVTVELEGNAEINIPVFTKGKLGTVKSKYMSVSTYRTKNIAWKQQFRYKDTRQIPLLEGTQFISAFLKIGQLETQIFSNQSYVTYAHGICFYYWENQVRFGTLQKNRNWRMEDCGIKQKRNYPPGFGCQHCGEQIVCSEDCPDTDIRVETVFVYDYSSSPQDRTSLDYGNETGGYG